MGFNSIKLWHSYEPKLLAGKTFVNIHGQPVLHAHVPTFHSLAECPACVCRVRIDIMNRFEIVSAFFRLTERAMKELLSPHCTQIENTVTQVTYGDNDLYSFRGPQPGALSASMGYAPKPAIVQTKEKFDIKACSKCRSIQQHVLPHSFNVRPK